MYEWNQLCKSHHGMSVWQHISGGSCLCDDRCTTLKPLIVNMQGMLPEFHHCQMAHSRTVLYTRSVSEILSSAWQWIRCTTDCTFKKPPAHKPSHRSSQMTPRIYCNVHMENFIRWLTSSWTSAWTARSISPKVIVSEALQSSWFTYSLHHVIGCHGGDECCAVLPTAFKALPAWWEMC